MVILTDKRNFANENPDHGKVRNDSRTTCQEVAHTLKLLNGIEYSELPTDNDEGGCWPHPLFASIEDPAKANGLADASEGERGFFLADSRRLKYELHLGFLGMPIGAPEWGGLFR